MAAKKKVYPFQKGVVGATPAAGAKGAKPAAGAKPAKKGFVPFKKKAKK